MAFKNLTKQQSHGSYTIFNFRNTVNVNTTLKRLKSLLTGDLLHYVMLTPLLTDQALKNGNMEHFIKIPIVERLGKLITGRERFTCSVGKNWVVPWKCPSTHRPEGRSEHCTQADLEQTESQWKGRAFWLTSRVCCRRCIALDRAALQGELLPDRGSATVLRSDGQCRPWKCRQYSRSTAPLLLQLLKVTPHDYCSSNTTHSVQLFNKHNSVSSQ